MLLALLVNSLSQLLQGFLWTVLPALGHEESTKSDVKRGSVSVDFLFSNKTLFVASFLVVVLVTLEQVPVGSNQELLSLLQLGSTHSDVSLSKDEVGW